MTKKIEPSLKTIGKYFELENDAFFCIPEYQRAYTWQKEHCDKLWSNIEDYSESDEKDKDNYFFGTVILSCEKDEAGKEDKKLVLIDGQQRTTTFLLLLKALLMKINAVIPNMPDDEETRKLRNALCDRRREITSLLYHKDKDDIGSEPSFEDEKIYRDFRTLKNQSINENDEYKKELTKILEANYFSQAEERVIKIAKKQKENKYTNFFRNFKFFYDKVDSMNESQLNKITRTIIQNCEIIEIRSWQIKQAIEMFNSLNSDGQPLEDADIISAKLYASTDNDNIETLKNKWEEIKSLSAKLSEKGVLKGIDTIMTQYMYYRRARDGKVDVKMEGLRKYYTESDKGIIENPIETCEDLLKIAKIWDKICDYPSVQVLSKLNENAKTFLGNYLFKEALGDITEESIQPIVRSLQRLFTILELSSEGYSSKNFKVFLFAENIKMVDSNVSPEEIENDFAAHINTIWNKEGKGKEDICQRISDYEGNALVYLNEYLVGKERNVRVGFGEAHDIEHIMPGSGKNKQLIRRDAGIETEEDFQNYINKIGNKIVLEYNINRSIGDEWFRTKVSTKLNDKTGYIDSKFPIANMLVEKYKNTPKPYWTKEDIDDATEKASNRIADYIFSL